MTNVRLPVDIQNRVLEFTHKCENCGLVSLDILEIERKPMGKIVLCKHCCTFGDPIGNPIDLTTESLCDYFHIDNKKFEGPNNKDKQIRYRIVGDRALKLKQFGVNILSTIAYEKRCGKITGVSLSVVHEPFCILLYPGVSRSNVYIINLTIYKNIT